MKLPPAIAERFELQSEACERLGSPFTALLCRLLPALLDGGTATGARIEGWPPDRAGPDALVLRLCGALHALVLDGRAPALAGAYPPNPLDEAALRIALDAALRTHDAFVCGFLDSPPQTNEVARSAMLLPGLLTVARETGLPVELAEIGSSAGLNLSIDRFAYSYGDAAWGEPASPLRLAPELRGAPPPLDGALEIVARAGCDIAPVDLADPASAQRLRAYVWADQPHRLERLDAAIAIALASGIRPARQDAAAFVGEALAARRRDTALVLMHSIMWQYLPVRTQHAIAAMLAAAGEAADPSAPLAWLRLEPLGGPGGFATLMLTLWPGGQTRHLARCDFHGRWIDWIARP